MQVIERIVKGHTLYTLKAEEGMFITDGKSYAKTVHLGLGASTCAFRDATPEEYEKAKGGAKESDII